MIRLVTFPARAGVFVTAFGLAAAADVSGSDTLGAASRFVGRLA